jgi:ribonuclease H2 subunit A
MVYGAAFCAVSYKPSLAQAAFADSKTLTEEKRDALFAQLKKDAAMGWIVDSISAEALSTKMLRRCARARRRERSCHVAAKS